MKQFGVLEDELFLSNQFWKIYMVTSKGFKDPMNKYGRISTRRNRQVNK